MQSHHNAWENAHIELASRLAQTLGIGEKALNEVDYDDLYVSETVIKTLHQLAMSIMTRIAREEGLQLNAYWVKDSMELVLCADSGNDLHVVRVPEDHWAFKPRTYH